VEVSDKAGVLGQFWMEFRDDEILRPFVEFNDVGLPLSFFIASGIVQMTPMAEEYITETFGHFISALEITEEELGELDNLNDILDFARIKKESSEEK
jgi:hypothetical protein